MHVITARWSSKSSTSYIAGLEKLYQSGKITKIDYISMKGAALVMLFGYPENEILKWMEKELSQIKEGEKNGEYRGSN